MAKENKQTFTFACQPSIVEIAKGKAFKEGSNLSEKVQSLLFEYSQSGNGIPNAMSILADELKADKGYYYGWQSNIAMAVYDEFTNFKKKKGKKCINYEDMHTIANNAAKNFLNLLIKPRNK